MHTMAATLNAANNAAVRSCVPTSSRNLERVDEADADRSRRGPHQHRSPIDDETSEEERSSKARSDRHRPAPAELGRGTRGEHPHEHRIALVGAGRGPMHESR